MQMPPRLAGFYLFRGLVQGKGIGKGQQVLRADFKGREPEVEGDLVPTRLGRFGQIGQFDQVGIGGQIGAANVGLDAPERHVTGIVVIVWDMGGIELLKTALSGLPDRMAIGAVQGQGVASAGQVPSALRAERGDEGNRPISGIGLEQIGGYIRSIGIGNGPVEDGVHHFLFEVKWSIEQAAGLADEVLMKNRFGQRGAELGGPVGQNFLEWDLRLDENARSFTGGKVQLLGLTSKSQAERKIRGLDSLVTDIDKAFFNAPRGT